MMVQKLAFLSAAAAGGGYAYYKTADAATQVRAIV
jgi:hypothetical protein